MVRHFFATADDLMPVFARAESGRALTYTLTGLLESPRLTTVARGADLATLRAPASAPDAIGGPAYLVTAAGAAVRTREVPQRDGGVRYAVDQLSNPDSVALAHGAFFGPDVLLNGWVGTASDSPMSKALFRAFASAVGKQFARIKAFWVGPQAADFLRRGYRLTGSAHSPREYDLVP
jgi:hypothetical protein